MSEIKLTAKRKNTDDWLLFCLSDLFHSAETGLYQVCVEDVGLFAIDPATIQPADDPRKAMSEHEVLTRVQAMGEESLSPDIFEGLMRALEALKTTRNVDGDSEDPRKAMLDEIHKKLGYVQVVEDKVNGWGLIFRG